MGKPLDFYFLFLLALPFRDRFPNHVLLKHPIAQKYATFDTFNTSSPFYHSVAQYTRLAISWQDLQLAYPLSHSLNKAYLKPSP
jgi:hypothetical protein